MFKHIKKGWENIWLPAVEDKLEIEISQKKAQIDLAKDKKYESRWVWYHTVLAVELFIIIIILIGIWWKL
jgi:hypothetical protein